MLSCHDLAHHHASDYIDGQLGWRAGLRVRLHLLVCVHCRHFVHQLRLVRKVLRRRDHQPDSSDRESHQVALQSLSEQLHQLHDSQPRATTSHADDR